MGDQDDADLENYFSMSYNNFEPLADYSPKNIKEIKQSFEVKKREKRKKSRKSLPKSVNFSKDRDDEIIIL